MNVFAKATRGQWRFKTSKGLITVEDLWGLPLTGDLSLNHVAINLDTQIAATGIKSFVPETLSSDTKRVRILTDMLEIVKYIIEVKLAAQEAAKKAVATRQRNNKIREIIAAKEDQSLQDMPLEKLKELLEDE